MLAICRGFQELNVALGGSLHQHVHEIPGRLDHREPKNVPPDVEYGPAHAIAIAPGGLLARLSGLTEAMVNSLHHQGVDRLARDLKIEAEAPDSQIEAVSLPGAKGFLLGVQWHPEWAFAQDPASCAISGRCCDTAPRPWALQIASGDFGRNRQQQRGDLGKMVMTEIALSL